MTDLHRVHVACSNFPGAPGVLTLHCQDAPALMTSLQTWLNAMVGHQPTGFTYTIQGNGDIFDYVTGEVSSTWTATAPAASVSTSTDTYAAGVGVIVHWKSDSYLSGRLLRGRSFIVPVNRSSFDTDGSLTSDSLSNFRSQCASFVTAATGNLAIWQRPRLAKAADGSRPAVTARGGGWAGVVSSVVPDRGAWLRSRRP